ncbi:MAG: GNAT family N-acetyltransferase [Flavobacteriaceae bacterium]
MVKLKGDIVYLRALEPEDLNFLYKLENNPEIWEVSGTLTPYSKHVLQLYLKNSHRDIFEVKQLRLCICNNENEVIGLIDLYDYDPKHRRAGVGIIIMEKDQRNRGAGTEALSLMIKYAFSILDLRQIYANVGEENAASIKLFGKLGFENAGLKKDWIRAGSSYKSEYLFQKINT